MVSMVARYAMEKRICDWIDQLHAVEPRVQSFSRATAARLGASNESYAALCPGKYETWYMATFPKLNKQEVGIVNTSRSTSAEAVDSAAFPIRSADGALDSLIDITITTDFADSDGTASTTSTELTTITSSSAEQPNAGTSLVDGEMGIAMTPEGDAVTWDIGSTKAVHTGQNLARIASFNTTPEEVTASDEMKTAQTTNAGRTKTGSTFTTRVVEKFYQLVYTAIRLRNSVKRNIEEAKAVRAKSWDDALKNAKYSTRIARHAELSYWVPPALKKHANGKPSCLRCGMTPDDLLWKEASERAVEEQGYGYRKDREGRRVSKL